MEACEIIGQQLRPDKRNGRSASEQEAATGRGERGGDNSEKRKTIPSIKRCFNCGMRDHLSVSCPSRDLGAKCFKCGEFGHIAARCSKKRDVVKNSCVVEHSLRKSYTKNVAINGVEIEALIDTGSDISLMRADEYTRIGSPRFQATKTRFSGVGSGNEITAMGEFQARVTIDEHSYPILIRIVSCAVLKHKLLIGTDFLDTVEVNARHGLVTTSPPCR